MTPRPDQQHITDNGPARGRGPRGLQHHRPRQVAPPSRDCDIRRPQPEPAGPPVQDRSEYARAVHARQAHPLHVAAGRDQRGHLAVREETVVGDRREWASAQHRPDRTAAPGRALSHRSHPPHVTRAHPPGQRAGSPACTSAHHPQRPSAAVGRSIFLSRVILISLFPAVSEMYQVSSGLAIPEAYLPPL